MTDTAAELRIPEAPRIPEPSGIPGDWFKSYIEGNNLIPQANGAITIYSLGAVLENPPANWKEFVGMQLSAEQRDELAGIMTRAHLGQGIPAVAEGKAEGDQEEIQNRRIAGLWDGTRDMMFNVVKHHIYLSSQGKAGISPYRLTPYQEAAGFDQYYSTEQGALALDSLRVAALKAREVLLSPEARGMLETNRRTTMRIHRSEYLSQAKTASMDKRENLSDIGNLLHERLLGEGLEESAVTAIASIL